MTNEEAATEIHNWIEADGIGEISIFSLSLAISALREKMERENPKPLALDELQEMGETDWVWLTFPELTPEESGWYRAKRTYATYSHRHYGETWLAYRSEPKEAQDER